MCDILPLYFHFLSKLGSGMSVVFDGYDERLLLNVGLTERCLWSRNVQTFCPCRYFQKIAVDTDRLEKSEHINPLLGNSTCCSRGLLCIPVALTRGILRKSIMVKQKLQVVKHLPVVCCCLFFT